MVLHTHTKKKYPNLLMWASALGKDLVEAKIELVYNLFSQLHSNLSLIIVLPKEGPEMEKLLDIGKALLSYSSLCLLLHHCSPQAIFQWFV